MIKLIATDMDGTLLDENKQLPENLANLCKKLKSMGILFAISSGRSFGALEYVFNDFDDIKNDFIYICDNGGNIILPNSDSITSTIPADTVKSILEDCKKIGNIVPVLCCIDDMYYPTSAKEQFRNEINNFYINFSMVDDISAVESPVIKIAICDMKGSLEHSYPILNDKYGKDMNCVVSGKFWMDIMCSNVSKGNAIESIQKKYNITYEETMAFGDYFNDVPMLEKASFSYVMENACNEMKKYGKFTAPPNTHNGVVETICKILNINL